MLGQVVIVPSLVLTIFRVKGKPVRVVKQEVDLNCSLSEVRKSKLLEQEVSIFLDCSMFW